MLYKCMIIVLATYCNIIFANDVWIAMEKTVTTAMQESQFKFSYTDEKTDGIENFYLTSETEFPKISSFIHQKFHRCGGFHVLKSSPDLLRKNINKSQVNLMDYSINQNSLVTDSMNEIKEDYMNSMVTHLSAYKTRYYKSVEGRDALLWIGAEWKKLTSHRNDVSMEYYEYKNHEQPTVILTIKGHNPDLTSEIIILGGHGDSINTDDTGIHSCSLGADDNAAGIAVLSEILRIIMLKNYAPERTIQFIAYAAEEEGIQGSYELASVYREKKINVVGVIQFDGVNYAGKSYDMALIKDNTNRAQNKFVASLIDEYVKVSWTWDKCGYACSDHAAWNYEMYPASYAIEATLKESNPFIHTENDTFEKSQNSTNHATAFVRLGLAYLIELDR